MKFFFPSFFVFLFFAVFTSTALPALAAELSVQPERAVSRPGEQLSVRISVDTKGKSANAFEGTIVFPDTLLTLESVRDSDSIVSVWIEKPALYKEGTVTFSGITPGGYAGSRGVFFDLVFRIRSSGTGTIRANDVQILSNDGVGTPLSVTVTPGSFTVSETAEIHPDTVTTDRTPPESFTVQLAQDPNAFEAKRFIVFLTHDKGSGAVSYTVCESFFSSCIKTESPYVLHNQAVDDLVRVIAVDSEGNERVGLLFTAAAQIRYALYALAAILLGGFIAVFVLRRRK